jgi:hypothetical protein
VSGAIAFDSAKDSGAGEIQLTAFFYDGTVQRFILPLVVFTEMNAQHFGFAFEFHGRTAFLRSAS